MATDCHTNHTADRQPKYPTERGADSPSDHGADHPSADHPGADHPGADLPGANYIHTNLVSELWTHGISSSLHGHISGRILCSVERARSLRTHKYLI